MANNNDDWQDVDDWEDVSESFQAPRVPMVYSPGQRRLEESKDMVNQMGYNDPNKIQKGAENAVSVMSGGLSKAIPAMGKGAMRFVTPYVEGGLQGAAQSPDDRIGGAVRGALAQGMFTNIGQGVSGLANWLKGGAKQATVNQAVAQGKSGEFLTGQADDAANKLRQKIGEREAELGETLSPEGYEINPDMVEKTFPRYAKKLADKRGYTEVPDGLGGTVLQKAEQGRVPLSSEQTRRLWKGANKASNFNPSDALNPTARAKSEDALALGDSIRREVYGKTPQAEDVMEKMAEEIQAKNYLTSKAVQRNPQAALSSDRLGTNKMEVLMDVDKRISSDLAKTGQRMSKARDLSRPFEWAKPVESGGRMLERKAYDLAGATEPTARKIGMTLEEYLAPLVRQTTIQKSKK